MIFVERTRDLAPHWNVIPFVRTAGIPSQIQFRVNKNAIHFNELSKVRGLGLLIEQITFWSKNLPVEGTEGAYCGIRISPAIRFEAANCRWKLQNYFENLERQFVSKFVVQETPYGYKPKFAPTLIIQICARSALSLITWLLYFFWRGKGILRKAKLMEDGAQEKLYEYINSNSLQSLITQICARSKSLSILWNFLKIEVARFFEDAINTHRISNILPMAFRTYRSWPLAHTPARNICGRSKLWCWRHRCTVRGSTLGAVYTSYFTQQLVSWQ